MLFVAFQLSVYRDQVRRQAVCGLEEFTANVAGQLLVWQKMHVVDVPFYATFLH